MLGLVATLILSGSLAIALVAREAPRPSLSRTPGATSVNDTAAPITRSQATQVRAVRHLARERMHLAQRRLGSCGAEGSPATTRACARDPLMTLAVEGRINASGLGALADGLPDGRCRDLTLGGRNALTLIGSEASLLVRRLTDTSRRGRLATTAQLLSVQRLVTTLTSFLGQPTWTACRVGAGRLSRRA
jgi:hypothetical protein